MAQDGTLKSVITRLMPLEPREKIYSSNTPAFAATWAPPHCSSGRTSRRSSTCAGAGPATHTARRAFRLRRGQRCGDHDARRYLTEVNAVKLQFARLAASG